MLSESPGIILWYRTVSISASHGSFSHPSHSKSGQFGGQTGAGHQCAAVKDDDRERTTKEGSRKHPKASRYGVISGKTARLPFACSGPTYEITGMHLQGPAKQELLAWIARGQYTHYLLDCYCAQVEPDRSERLSIIDFSFGQGRTRGSDNQGVQGVKAGRKIASKHVRYNCLIGSSVRPSQQAPWQTRLFWDEPAMTLISRVAYILVKGHALSAPDI